MHMENYRLRPLHKIFSIENKRYSNEIHVISKLEGHGLCNCTYRRPDKAVQTRADSQLRPAHNLLCLCAITQYRSKRLHLRVTRKGFRIWAVGRILRRTHFRSSVGFATCLRLEATLFFFWGKLSMNDPQQINRLWFLIWYIISIFTRFLVINFHRDLLMYRIFFIGIWFSL